METFNTHLTAFFQWLLRATLQGSLLVCLILAIKLVLRERLPARWHYCLWLVLLVRLSLPWAPQSRLSIYNLVPALLPSHEAAATSVGGVRPGVSGAQPGTSGQDETTGLALAGAQGEAPQQGRGGTAVSAAPMVPGRQSRGPVARRSLIASAVHAAPWLWLAGCAVLGGYVFIRAFHMWRAVASERPVTDQPILELLEDCKMQTRVRTLVGVVVTDRSSSPALFGFIRPRILLPQGLIETLGLDELHHVFLHELAHLKRRDIYLAWLVCLLQVLHWFNPLMWLAFRRMRADQEMAADAMALAAAGTDASRRYGQTIMRLLERFSRAQYLPSLTGILENPSQIERRIQMIAKSKNGSRISSVMGITVIVVLGTIAMIDPTRGAMSASPAPEAKAPMTMRLVQKEIEDHVSISPDGRYLCGCATWAAAGEGIAIRELATGAQRTIKPRKRTPEWSDPQYPILSPDNKKIAYCVGRDAAGRADLCLIEVDGSGQRVVYRGVVRPIKEPAGSEVPLQHPGVVRPIQWFPDGSRLLGLRWRDPMHAFTEIEIVSVALADGSVQVIKTLTGEFFRTTIRLSPDGKFVAYETSSQDSPAKRDIFAVEIDSQRETLLVGHAADDRLLDWTPGGDHILFISDRSSSWSAWLLSVAAGQAQGTPELVARSTGDIKPVGFAEDGSYYYRMRYSAGDIYTATINLTTGQVLSAPAPLEAAGSNRVADWSPDGKYLAYCSSPVTSNGPRVIRIRSLETGNERELPNRLTDFTCLRWSPDGRSLLASDLIAHKPEETSWPGRVCRIDVATGGSTILLEEKNNYEVMMAELSPDGNTLFYNTGLAITRRDINTGAETDIFKYTSEAPWAAWALSPDGESIAAGDNEVRDPNRSDGWIKKVLLITAKAGQATELMRWDEPAGYLTNMCWSPDGKHVLFMLHKNEKQTDEFWQVPTEGGQPRKIMEARSSMGRPYGLRVHPDGQRIVFSESVVHGELWAMENFLPAGAISGDSN